MDGTNALRGGVRGHFFGQSSFAAHALATVRNLVKVPKPLPLALLAPLGCGLQTGAGTVMNSLAVRAGSSIAVFAEDAMSAMSIEEHMSSVTKIFLRIGWVRKNQRNTGRSIARLSFTGSGTHFD